MVSRYSQNQQQQTYLNHLQNLGWYCKQHNLNLNWQGQEPLPAKLHQFLAANQPQNWQLQPNSRLQCNQYGICQQGQLRFHTAQQTHHISLSAPHCQLEHHETAR